MVHFLFTDTESEEELPEPTMNLIKSEPAASDPSTTKQVKIVEPKKEDDSSDEDEEGSSAEDEESSEGQVRCLAISNLVSYVADRLFLIFWVNHNSE